MLGVNYLQSLSVLAISLSIIDKDNKIIYLNDSNKFHCTSIKLFEHM